jgi:membrane protein DedA with SNARE-associated domain
MTGVSNVLTTLLTAPAWLVYLLVGVLAFGEAAAFIGLVLPGETALLFGGVAAAHGHASLPILLAIGGLAAVAGDSVGYEMGRHGGDRLRRSRVGRLVGEPRWERAERFVARRGPIAVLLGRWVGVLRSLVPVLAGITRMRYRRFLLWNALGGLTWSSTVLLLGYAAGSALNRIQTSLGTAGLLVGAAGAAIAGIVVVRRRARVTAAARRWARHRRQRRAAAAQPGTPLPHPAPDR